MHPRSHMVQTEQVEVGAATFTGIDAYHQVWCHIEGSGGNDGQNWVRAGLESRHGLMKAKTINTRSCQVEIGCFEDIDCSFVNCNLYILKNLWMWSALHPNAPNLHRPGVDVSHMPLKKTQTQRPLAIAGEGVPCYEEAGWRKVLLNCCCRLGSLWGSLLLVIQSDVETVASARRILLDCDWDGKHHEKDRRFPSEWQLCF